MARTSLPHPIPNRPSPGGESVLVAIYRRLSPPEREKLVALAQQIELAAARRSERYLLH